MSLLYCLRNDSCLLYVQIETCRKVENVLNRFDRKGSHIKILPFHAALAQEMRLANIKEFLNSQSADSMFLICTDRYYIKEHTSYLDLYLFSVCVCVFHVFVAGSLHYIHSKSFCNVLFFLTAHISSFPLILQSICYFCDILAASINWDWTTYL